MSRGTMIAIQAVCQVVMLMCLFLLGLYVAGALGVFDDPVGTRVLDVVIAVGIVGIGFGARWVAGRAGQSFLAAQTCRR